MLIMPTVISIKGDILLLSILLFVNNILSFLTINSMQYQIAIALNIFW